MILFNITTANTTTHCVLLIVCMCVLVVYCVYSIVNKWAIYTLGKCIQSTDMTVMDELVLQLPKIV